MRACADLPRPLDREPLIPAVRRRGVEVQPPLRFGPIKEPCLAQLFSPFPDQLHQQVSSPAADLELVLNYNLFLCCDSLKVLKVIILF